MRGEKGQALPMAIMALALGALAIAPFLGNAGSSLIGARLLGETIGQLSASDAGVENAIWSLTRGSLAGQFTGPGDEVTYQLGETLNGFSTTVTITANATSQNGTLGDIANTVIDTLVFDSSTCYLPSMIMVSSNICAVAYSGTKNKGYLITASINSGGDIGNSVISTVNFDTSNCYESDIIQVANNVFAIAFREKQNKGYLITASIAANGVIGSSVIDTLIFDTSNCYEPAISQVASNIYAIAYRGSSNRGYLKTVSIAANGDIGNSVIDSLTFDTSNCYEPNIIQVSGSTYAITYRGPSNQGFLKTVSITSSGEIGASAIDTFIFDASTCYEPDIIQVSGSTYAIAYRGNSNKGLLKTVSITTGGDISASVIDTLQFDVTCYEPDIIYAAGDVYSIAYRGNSNRGYLKTMSIAANGDIGSSVIDTLQFDTSTCYEPVIVNVTNDIFAIAYRGSGNQGYIITLGITTRAALSATWEIVATAGDCTIRALVNTANTTATIVSWRIE